jgi:hypothetical protein
MHCRQEGQGTLDEVQQADLKKQLEAREMQHLQLIAKGEAFRSGGVHLPQSLLDKAKGRWLNCLPCVF